MDMGIKPMTSAHTENARRVSDGCFYRTVLHRISDICVGVFDGSSLDGKENE